jgi:TetR/AcrR family transcriptional regulator, transcriptional repressor for nem operon
MSRSEPTTRSEQKQQTRQRILDAAGRGFRKGGFGGAFYVHFDSKATAFRESVVKGMSDLKEGVRHFQKTHGKTWWPEFVRFYLGTKRTCELAESCALQSLPPEVARSDATARSAFEAELLEVAAIVASGPSSVDAPETVEAAFTALATLVGTVTLARAVENKAVSERIAAAAERVLLPSRTAPTNKASAPACRPKRS